MAEKKMFWACLSYHGKCLERRLDSTASIYSGFTERKVTMKDIANGKKDAGLNKDAVLIAVSWLGYMTKSEVLDGYDPETKCTK